MASDSAAFRFDQPSRGKRLMSGQSPNESQQEAQVSKVRTDLIRILLFNETR
jgi:hypothetical protein